MTAGAFAASLDPRQGLTPGELGALVAEFNVAAERLQTTHEALRGEVVRLRSELSTTKRRLRRARRLAQLGEVAAGIAHEVRNPLGSIKLYAEALAADLADRPAERGTAVRIEQAVDALDAVVRDVLTLARDLHPRTREVPVRDAAARAARACADLIAASGAAFELGDGAADAVVRADPALLDQALVNIVRNACECLIEAAPAPPVRRVVIEAGPGMLRDEAGRAVPTTAIRVTDTGPGIGPEAAERACNPFYTTRDAGTGLGLAIVHRIIDAHAGRVDIWNNADRRPGAPGATVELALPDAPRPVGEAEEART